MVINKESHNQSTCRKLETVKDSVLNGTSVSHPLFSRFGDHYRRGYRKILRAYPVENIVKLSIFWANKAIAHMNPQHPWLHVQDQANKNHSMDGDGHKVPSLAGGLLATDDCLGRENQFMFCFVCLFCFLPGISPWEASLTSLAVPTVVPVWQH